MNHPMNHTDQPRRGRPPVNTGPCRNCQSAPAAVRGLCRPRDDYQRKTGNTRPLTLEARLNERRARTGGRCLCGEFATMTIKTHLGKMELCPAHYRMELRQAAGEYEG